MTKRDYFTIIMETMQDNADVVNFCQHEIELLDSKRGSLKKPTAQQEANKELIAVVLEVMQEAATPMTINEILAYGGERLEGVKSNQHMNSLLIKMRGNGQIERVYEKKTAKFVVAGISPHAPEEVAE